MAKLRMSGIPQAMVHGAATGSDPGTVTVHVPVTFRRRCGRKALVMPDGRTTTRETAPFPQEHPATVKALARAFRWRRLIEAGDHATVHEIAEAERINPSYVSRVLRLTLLAPYIVECLLAEEGDAGIERFTKPFAIDWADQAKSLLRR